MSCYDDYMTDYELDAHFAAGFLEAMNAEFAESSAKPEDIEEFEDTTGNIYDPNGPPLIRCEYCNELSQYADDHWCYGTAGESAEAARFEDDH